MSTSNSSKNNKGQGLPFPCDTFPRVLHGFYLGLLLQPICDSNQRLIGYEVLSRARAEDGRVLMPSKFIDAVIESKKNEEWLLTAIMQLLGDVSDPSISYFINISPKHLELSNIQAFQNKNTPVVFEITEHQRTHENINTFLNNIRDLLKQSQQSNFCHLYAIDDITETEAQVLDQNFLSLCSYLKIEHSLFPLWEKNESFFNIIIGIMNTTPHIKVVFEGANGKLPNCDKKLLDRMLFQGINGKHPMVSK